MGRSDWKLAAVFFAALVIVTGAWRFHKLAFAHPVIRLTAGEQAAMPSKLPYRVFPADNPWNQDISQAPVDPMSAIWIAILWS